MEARLKSLERSTEKVEIIDESQRLNLVEYGVDGAAEELRSVWAAMASTDEYVAGHEPPNTAMQERMHDFEDKALRFESLVEERIRALGGLLAGGRASDLDARGLA